MTGAAVQPMLPFGQFAGAMVLLFAPTCAVGWLLSQREQDR